jgi:hypothetical protein
MQLRSVLERELPPSEAEGRLGALRAQTRDYGLACSLAILGAGVAIAVEPRLAVALAAAALLTLALAGRSVWRRRELVSALLRERDAYSIDAVRHRATRFATLPRRRRLGSWLRSLVLVADGEELPPSLNLRVIDDRVRARRERILRIADAFEVDGRQIHPASVALLHQLLTRPGLSPLYNPGLDEDLLDLALHRIEAGVEPV